MSLNQLLLDEIKPYLNLRCNNLVVDGDVEKYEGTLLYTGAIGGSSDYVAYVVGNMCMLRLNQHNPTAVASSSIETTNFPQNLVPTGAQNSFRQIVHVEDNGIRKIGEAELFEQAPNIYQLRVNLFNGTTFGAFTGSGATGWVSSIVICYQLDQ